MADTVETPENQESVDNGDRTTSPVEDMPDFSDRMKDWAVKALAIMSVKLAARTFFYTFPVYDDERYGNTKYRQHLVYKRLENMKYDKTRPYRDMIEAQKEAIALDLLDTLPYTNAVNQLIKLHEILLFEDLKPLEQVRVLSAIDKITDRVRGVDTTKTTTTSPDGAWTGAQADFSAPPIGRAHQNLHEDQSNVNQER